MAPESPSGSDPPEIHFHLASVFRPLPVLRAIPWEELLDSPIDRERPEALSPRTMFAAPVVRESDNLRLMSMVLRLVLASLAADTAVARALADEVAQTADDVIAGGNNHA